MLLGVSLRLRLRGGNINFAPFYQSYSEAKDKEHNLRDHFNEKSLPGISLTLRLRGGSINSAP